MTEDQFVRWVGEWLLPRVFKGSSSVQLAILLENFDLDDLTPEVLAALTATIHDDVASAATLATSTLKWDRADPWLRAGAIVYDRWNTIISFAAAYNTAPTEIWKP